MAALSPPRFLAASHPPSRHDRQREGTPGRRGQQPKVLHTKRDTFGTRGSDSIIVISWSQGPPVPLLSADERQNIEDMPRRSFTIAEQQTQIFQLCDVFVDRAREELMELVECSGEELLLYSTDGTHRAQYERSSSLDGGDSRIASQPKREIQTCDQGSI